MRAVARSLPFVKKLLRSGASAASACGRAAVYLCPRDRAELGRVALCLVAGGVAAAVAFGGSGPSSHARTRAHAATVLEVTLDDRPLPRPDAPEDEILEAARAIARAYVAAPVTVRAPGGESAATAEKTRAELGARVEPERLEALVAAIRDPASPLRRAHAQHVEAGVAQPLRLPLPVSLDGERGLAALLTLKDDLDRRPVDAHIDLATRKIVRDEPGVRVDVYATLARLDAALTFGERTIDAVVETVPASRVADKIGEVALDDVLGFFETRYTPDAKHEARTYNLRLAASKLDGHVVMPGEVFDFNDVVGPRSEANGYKVATVIAQGELVDGVGGGTCQIAGTLHGAAFFAGLDIVERKPHTRPSFYIKMGMDATVVYPTITMRLRNPFDFPIVLHETVEDGVVRAEILGKKRLRDVTFIRKINEVTPFAEREVDDPKIPRGHRVLAQRGIPGFKLTRFRVIREDDKEAVREKTTDAYPSTSQIWRVGTGDPSALPPFEGGGDDHPEYVVDEYLTLAQGPHVVNPRTGQPDLTPGGRMVESRVPGRYGTRGWTRREGFARRNPRDR